MPAHSTSAEGLPPDALVRTAADGSTDLVRSLQRLVRGTQPAIARRGAYYTCSTDENGDFPSISNLLEDRRPTRRAQCGRRRYRTDVYMYIDKVHSLLGGLALGTGAGNRVGIPLRRPPMRPPVTPKG